MLRNTDIQHKECDGPVFKGEANFPEKTAFDWYFHGAFGFVGKDKKLVRSKYAKLPNQRREKARVLYP